jgi:hypothetical protein
MTSILEMTADELKRKIEKLRDLGWIRSYRKGDTGIGHTMEGLLGYRENNIALPDWGLLEVKTTRRDSNTPITLFSKSPKLIPGLGRKEFIEKHGYWDDTRHRQALYTTLNATSENSLGWKMNVDRVTDSILFMHNGELVATQDPQSLEKKMAEKISNLVLIIADRKLDGKDEYFQYNEAYLLADADHERLLELIETGDITFDWRMHLRENGTVRDHGPGYRMLETKLHNLYSHRERLV